MRDSTVTEIKHISNWEYKIFQPASPDWRVPRDGYYDISFMTLHGILRDISERLQKLEELTEANNYDYQTETKLVKIKKEKTNDK
jgi:hypothetical protein